MASSASQTLVAAHDDELDGDHDEASLSELSFFSASRGPNSLLLFEQRQKRPFQQVTEPTNSLAEQELSTNQAATKGRVGRPLKVFGLLCALSGRVLRNLNTLNNISRANKPSFRHALS